MDDKGQFVVPAVVRDGTPAGLRAADLAGLLPPTPWADNACADCGTHRNPRWYAPTPLWLHVMADEHTTTVCPLCFAERVYAAGLAPVAFTVNADFHWETTASVDRRREQAARAAEMADYRRRKQEKRDRDNAQ